MTTTAVDPGPNGWDRFWDLVDEAHQMAKEGWGRLTKAYSDNPEFRMFINGTVELAAIAITKKPTSVRKVAALAMTVFLKK